MPAGHAEPEAIVTQTAASRWTAAAKRAEEQGEDSALAQRRVAHLSPSSRPWLAQLVLIGGAPVRRCMQAQLTLCSSSSRSISTHLSLPEPSSCNKYSVFGLCVVCL